MEECFNWLIRQKMDQQEEWHGINIMLLQMVVILMLEVDLELITLLLESLRMDRLLQDAGIGSWVYAGGVDAITGKYINGYIHEDYYG